MPARAEIADGLGIVILGVRYWPDDNLMTNKNVFVLHTTDIDSL